MFWWIPLRCLSKSCNFSFLCSHKMNMLSCTWTSDLVFWLLFLCLAVWSFLCRGLPLLGPGGIPELLHLSDHKMNHSKDSMWLWGHASWESLLVKILRSICCMSSSRTLVSRGTIPKLAKIPIFCTVIDCTTWANACEFFAWSDFPTSGQVDLLGTSRDCVLEEQYNSFLVLVVFLSYESSAGHTD
jgi:hypothetical protein